jgi:hypothetical protein
LQSLGQSTAKAGFSKIVLSIGEMALEMGYVITMYKLYNVTYFLNVNSAKTYAE